MFLFGQFVFARTLMKLFVEQQKLRQTNRMQLKCFFGAIFGILKQTLLNSVI